MKKIVSIILVGSILVVGCSNNIQSSNVSSVQEPSESVLSVVSVESSSTSLEESITQALESVYETTAIDYSEFGSMNDSDLQDYVEDSTYTELDLELGSDDCNVLNVNAIYISQEYIDELEYNSQKNIYFGYTEDELEELFDEQPYYFTLGENGTTIVESYQPYTDQTNAIIRNVAIGSGVILLCISVEIISAELGAPAIVPIVFATAAQTGYDYAVLSAAIQGIAVGIIKGIQTGDYQEAIDAGTLAASEGFMWGAITGCIYGGITEYISAPAWMKTPGGHPTWMETETEYYELLIAEYGDDYLIRDQIAYLDGLEVSYNTDFATRPDIVISNPDNSIVAIELKNWDLERNLSGVTNELERQVGSRVINLPENSTQQIVFDVRGRGYPQEYLDYVEVYVTDALADVCPYDVPIIFWQ